MKRATKIRPAMLGAGRRCFTSLSVLLAVAAVFSITMATAAQDAPASKTANGTTAAKANSAKEKGFAALDYGLPQVAEINKQIRQVWIDNALQPSPPATDGEWCRRVFLDVIGRVPSVQELRKFVNSKEADKKSKLVSKLLYGEAGTEEDEAGAEDESYTEEYARNWTTIWTNILIGRNGGLEDRSLINRPGMQKYLRDSFARNKTYDKMVYELVTATGSCRRL